MADIPSLPPRNPARLRQDRQSKICHKCKKRGHIAAQCKEKSCFTCGSYDHYQRDCPESKMNGSLPSYTQETVPIQPAALPPPLHSNTASIFTRCAGCQSLFHETATCPGLKYNFSEANERIFDELPSAPVLLKPVKTAAALEAERKHAERQATGGEGAEGVQGHEKALGGGQNEAKKPVSKAKESGDLIEFD